jgi:hypothetical protein
MPLFAPGPLDKPCSRSLPLAIGVLLVVSAWRAWSDHNMSVATPFALLAAIELTAAWVLTTRRGSLALKVAIFHGAVVGVGVLIATVMFGSSMEGIYVVLLFATLGVVTVEVGQDVWKLLHLRQTTDGILTEPPQPFRIAGKARHGLIVVAGLVVVITMVQRTEEPSIESEPKELPIVSEHTAINFKKFSLLKDLTPTERLNLLVEIRDYYEAQGEMDSLAVYSKLAKKCLLSKSYHDLKVNF